MAHMAMESEPDELIEGLARAYSLVEPLIEELALPYDPDKPLKSGSLKRAVALYRELRVIRNMAEKQRADRAAQAQYPNRGLTLEEAARYCGMTPRNFKSWVARAGLKCKIPRSNAYDRYAIDQHLNQALGIVPDVPEKMLAAYDRWKAEERAKAEADAWFLENLGEKPGPPSVHPARKRKLRNK